jgi:hypothetical protein
MTGDSNQYQALVQPMVWIPSPTTTKMMMTKEDEDGKSSLTTMATSSRTTAHDLVCHFIQRAAEMDGLEVEVTAVDRNDVDKAKLEALVQSLGVHTPVRWRPYFP